MNPPSPIGNEFVVLNGSNPPLIGITTYRQQAKTGVWDVEAAFLHSAYIDSVTRAGGIAVLLPPQPASAEIAERVVSKLDGFVFAGGRDVDPARYGEPANENTDTPDLLRDEWEFSLLNSILDQKKPTLFICRGAQTLNVQKGGTLIQHLPDVVGSNKYQLGNAEFTDLELTVEPDTNLASIVGKSVKGCAYHHQAIDKVGAGLKVTARSSDGIIEAVEIDDYPFGVAVQWHPEVTSEADGRLFTALIESAANQGKRK